MKTKKKNTSPKAKKYSFLDPRYQRALDEAKKAMEESVRVYTNFIVGAAVVTKTGKVFHGGNHEFGAPIDLCAERVALFRVKKKYKPEVRRIAIITKFEDRPNKKIAYPCGCCRQAIAEYAKMGEFYDIMVIVSDTEMKKIKHERITSLIPEAFGPEDFK